MPSKHGVRSPAADAARSRAGRPGRGSRRCARPGRRRAFLAAEHAVAEPEVERSAHDDHEIAPLRAAERAFVTNCGWPPGTMPRPMPLEITGMPVSSTKRSAASSARSAHTSVPRISTGRVAPASSAAIGRQVVRVGLDGRGVGVRRVPTGAWLNNSSIGTSTKVGPRCDDPASGERVVTVGAMSSTVCAVVGNFVIGLEDRRVVELLQAAASPAAGGRVRR